MKTSYLYIFSLALLITGFLCIWSAWHGDSNFTSGIPVGLSSIQLCGSATFRRTLAGFLSEIVGIILYGVVLVTRPLRRSQSRFQVRNSVYSMPIVVAMGGGKGRV